MGWELGAHSTESSMSLTLTESLPSVSRVCTVMDTEDTGAHDTLQKPAQCTCELCEESCFRGSEFESSVCSQAHSVVADA